MTVCAHFEDDILPPTPPLQKKKKKKNQAFEINNVPSFIRAIAVVIVHVRNRSSPARHVRRRTQNKFSFNPARLQTSDVELASPTRL